MARKPGDIYLGLKGQEILLPAYGGRKVTPKFKEILREQETVTGALVSDLIGVRPAWTISYSDELFGPDVEALLDLYEHHRTLNLIIVDRLGNAKEYEVILRPPAMTRESIRDDWEWSGVTLELEAVRCYR